MLREKILIVEDERIIAESIKRCLSNSGYIVSSIVSSGEEAIVKVKDNRPDLVLIDIVLEGEMDGIEAASHIHTNFDIPVIYLTAYSDEGMLKRAKMTEPFGYIVKPFKNRELHSTIEMALYKHKMEKKLKESEKQLEQRVKERTAELEMQTKCLEEANTALKVLLKQREEDKRELEENILSNVKNLILPHLEKLKKMRLNENQITCIDLIESSIRDITSPFIKELSSKYLGLTHTEIRVASLIKEGKTTKEIAELLCLSEDAISFYRKNIRSKLGLKNKKINLNSYLQTF